MTTPPPTYRVEQQDPERAREAVLALWKTSGFGPQESAEAPRDRYDWLHLRNPAGPSRIYVLIEIATEKVVGAVGACTRLFFKGDLPIRGALLVDFVVDPAHRSLFPALMLQRVAREQELSMVSLVYAIPEPKAVPVFKRLGSDFVTSCRRFARVVRHRHVLGKLLWAPLAALVGGFIDLCDYGASSARLTGSQLSGQWASQVGPDLDRIWSSALATAGPLGQRTAAYLRWRFNECPGESNRVFLVNDKRTGDPRAYFICAPTGDAVALKDFLSVGSPHELVQALLLLARTVRREGTSVIYLDFAGNEAEQAALRAAHFVQRTERLCFVARAKGDGHANLTMDRMTRADEDV
jgi:hypothetical protein